MQSLPRKLPLASIAGTRGAVAPFSTRSSACRPLVAPLRQLLARPSALSSSHRSFHPTPGLAPRRRDFFTSNVNFNRSDEQQQDDASSSSKNAGGDGSSSSPPSSATTATPPLPTPERKPPRVMGAKKSLRRVAMIAQQQPAQTPPARSARPGSNNLANNSTATTTNTTSSSSSGGSSSSNGFTGQDDAESMSAVCLADEFHMHLVPKLLRSHGYVIDPDGTGFGVNEVVHARPTNASAPGDVFVFPSGTVVTWSHPPEPELATLLLPATEEAYDADRRETETLEYVEDATRETSTVMGSDRVVLGTSSRGGGGGGDGENRLATTLAKVAFSSGLARSTKLAGLESDLERYFAATKSIPKILASSRSRRTRARLVMGVFSSSSSGSFPFSRAFIEEKTGELLSLTARLNNYSELTDSLPDIFWDSRSELGLETYYDQLGRALDVNVRIRTLNQRLDYAQEIAAVLREMSAERHSTRLEWIIIILIAVEVSFELRKDWKEYKAARKAAALEKVAAAAAAVAEGDEKVVAPVISVGG